MTTEKFCTKCGKKFIATGREVICPACKQAAAEESKKAAVLKAKKASWAGESVPVRISGRASTVIREYGKANNLPFAAALDDLLKASDYFKSMGVKWENVEPYKSRRRSKSTTETTSTTETEEAQEAPQDVQESKQEVKQEVKQAAKTTSKKVASKATSKATSTSKAAGKKVKA